MILIIWSAILRSHAQGIESHTYQQRSSTSSKTLQTFVYLCSLYHHRWLYGGLEGVQGPSRCVRFNTLTMRMWNFPLYPLYPPIESPMVIQTAQIYKGLQRSWASLVVGVRFNTLGMSTWDCTPNCENHAKSESWEVCKCPLLICPTGCMCQIYTSIIIEIRLSANAKYVNSYNIMNHVSGL